MRRLSERPGHDMCPGNFAERTPHKKISQISPYYEISDKLTSQVVDMRMEYDEKHKTIS